MNEDKQTVLAGKCWWADVHAMFASPVDYVEAINAKEQKEIKHLHAEIDRFRMRLIRLREVLDD